MDLSQLIKTHASSVSAAGRPLNIVLGTSEVVPFSKTGGLADVSASLSKALAARGHKVAIVTPLYKFIDPEQHQFAKRLTALCVPRKAKTQRKLDVTIWEKRLAAGVTVYFLDAPEYFGRDDLYGYDGDNVEGAVERFAFFSRALVEFCREMPISVDILQLNDWHTALAPVYLDYYYKNETTFPTIMSLHNIAFQGRFDESTFVTTGLPKSFLTEDELLDDGQVVFLKGAIKYCDAITTVSPTHAKEITSEPGGFGLAADLNKRGDKIIGILNGADYSIWSPENDSYIPIRYTVESLNGKRQVKTAVQHELGLPVRPTLPLIGFVGRLTTQKGIDLLAVVLKQMLSDLKTEREGFQVAILGKGEKVYEDKLSELQRQFPNRLAFISIYSEEAAHKIIAGSDILLVPSRFEPCGLTQIYAQKYGTIPVVHSTGGLADTVIDYEEPNSTGFVINRLNSRTLAAGIQRALEHYSKHRQWRPLMGRAMEADFSWGSSAKKYESLYYEHLQRRGIDPGFHSGEEDSAPLGEENGESEGGIPHPTASQPTDSHEEVPSGVMGSNPSLSSEPESQIHEGLDRSGEGSSFGDSNY